MNRQRGGDSLDLNPRLLTQADGYQLELVAVLSGRARPCSRHRDTPELLGGSVHETGASTLVSCNASLDTVRVQPGLMGDRIVREDRQHSNLHGELETARASMPWQESGPMEERLQFVRDALRDRFTMSALCARYGVSRRVGYKWLARYEAEGRAGLTDRSHVPHH